jgi:hydroxymethylbilane synthase
VTQSLRLGTRGSALALAQATAVARSLETHGATVEIVTVRASGDERPPDEPPRADSGQGATETGPRSGAPGPAAPTPAAAHEDKARFVKELEQALLAEEIDLAVHSAKDVPSELLDGLEIVAVPERADARDALCLGPRLAASGDGAADGSDAGSAGAQSSPDASPARHSLAARPLDPLPDGATVGTASLRRRAELLALRPDLQIRELRGNVDTRLRKLADDEYDAIVLAAAGLARLDRADEGLPLSELSLIPAAGQGCLALEARTGDEVTRKLACRLTDPHAFACVTAERTLVMVLGATCNTPVGAHAKVVNHSFIELNAFVGTPDGKQWVRDDVRGMAEDPRSIGLDAANRLTAAGAPDILAAAETWAGQS